jgi:hypothetical protein
VDWYSRWGLSDPIQPEITRWPDLIATSVDRIRSRGVEVVQIRSRHRAGSSKKKQAPRADARRLSGVWRLARPALSPAIEPRLDRGTSLVGRPKSLDQTATEVVCPQAPCWPDRPARSPGIALAWDRRIVRVLPIGSRDLSRLRPRSSLVGRPSLALSRTRPHLGSRRPRSTRQPGLEPLACSLDHRRSLWSGAGLLPSFGFFLSVLFRQFCLQFRQLLINNNSCKEKYR